MTEVSIHQTCVAGDEFTDIQVRLGKMSEKMDHMVMMQEEARETAREDRKESRDRIGALEDRTRKVEDTKASWTAYNTLTKRVLMLENCDSSRTGKEKTIVYLITLAAGIAGALVGRFV